MTLSLIKTMLYIAFAISLVLCACFIKHDKMKKARICVMLLLAFALLLNVIEMFQ